MPQPTQTPPSAALEAAASPAARPSRGDGDIRSMAARFGGDTRHRDSPQLSQQ